MSGGADNDTFIFTNGFGADTITDFDALSNLERIDLAGVSSITDWTDLSLLGFLDAAGFELAPRTILARDIGNPNSW